MEKQYDKKLIGWIAGIVFLAVVTVWISITFFTNQRVKEIDVSAVDRLSAAGLVYNIDKLRQKHDYITITGYAYQPGISVDTVQTAVVIHDVMTDTYYELPTESVNKEKLTEDAGDGYNYDYAQFEAVAYKKHVPDASRVYILYRVNGSEILVETSEAIYY